MLHPSFRYPLEPSDGQEAQIHYRCYPESRLPVSVKFQDSLWENRLTNFQQCKCRHRGSRLLLQPLPRPCRLRLGLLRPYDLVHH